uniref:Uncharacterized protein n=1 Tax=Podarcis muralis TaxID=64176 RepID=A0A670HNW3_PODMU
MPEGPTVKRFQLQCSPFVGQAVTKVGGSTKQMNPDDLKGLVLQDTQVSLAPIWLPQIPCVQWYLWMRTGSVRRRPESQPEALLAGR